MSTNLLFTKLMLVFVALAAFIGLFTPNVADAVVGYLISEKPLSHAILFGVYAIVLGPTAFLYGLLENPKWLIPSVAVFLALATAITLLVGLLN